MKTLIKILCLSFFSIAFTNEEFSFVDDIRNENVKIKLKNNKEYTGKISSMNKIWITFIPLNEERKRIRTVKIQYIRSLDGSIIWNSNQKNLMFDSKKNNLISNNEIKTNQELLSSAGQNLVAYRNKSYVALILSFAGSALIISNPEDQTVGGILTLLSFILGILAINDVGKAGEKLQQVEIKD